MREPKGIRIMSVTATQPTVATARSETTVLLQSQSAALKHAPTYLNAAFIEQQGAGRLEEWAETLDFPLDFQI
jgi:hypothetical protein